VTTKSRVDTALTIQPLTAGRFGDLASLFDQGGDPKHCWCTWYRLPNQSYSKATTADRRAHLGDLAERAPAPGLVAYRDGRAVGWVSLGPREGYERLSRSTVLAPIDDRPVWSIVCFVVARKVRGQGVAHALLKAAIDYARAHGATLLEAYPTDTGDRRIPANEAFKGTLSMFGRAGFEVAEMRQATATSTPRPIVRRTLTAKGR
jgi:GNAT superfamily N-acetyltransferase